MDEEFIVERSVCLNETKVKKYLEEKGLHGFGK